MASLISLALWSVRYVVGEEMRGHGRQGRRAEGRARQGMEGAEKESVTSLNEALGLITSGRHISILLNC